MITHDMTGQKRDYKRTNEYIYYEGLMEQALNDFNRLRTVTKSTFLKMTAYGTWIIVLEHPTDNELSAAIRICEFTADSTSWLDIPGHGRS